MKRQWLLRVAVSLHSQFHSASTNSGSGSEGRFSDEWDDGHGGFQWKLRHLAERRNLAMEYLGNISKRVPIHDGIRARAKLSQDRLKNITNSSLESASSVLMESLAQVSGLNEDDEESDGDDSFDKMIELLDESVLDSLKNIPEHEVDHLVDELYGGEDLGGGVGEGVDAEKGAGIEAHSDDKFLREWFNLRKLSSPYQSYAAIPAEERNLWSPWYLQDVKASKPPPIDG